jgi:hypothetical protein
MNIHEYLEYLEYLFDILDRVDEVEIARLHVRREDEPRLRGR